MNETSTVAIRPQGIKRLIRPAKWGVGFLLVIAVLGFGIVPLLARPQIAALLSEQLGRQVSIERLRFNPFTLTAELEGIRLLEQNGTDEALHIDLLRANFELESLIRGGPVLHEFAIHGLQSRLIRETDAQYNWSDLIERLASQPASDTPTRFSVANIQLTGADISIDDHVKDIHHKITNLTLSIPFISNLPVKLETFTEPSLSAAIDGAPFILKGRTKPFSEERETILDIILEEFPLTPWQAYLPVENRFRLPSGSLSTKLEITFAQPTDKPPKIAISGYLQANKLVIQNKTGQPAFSAEEFGVELADVQPLIGKWSLSRLRLMRPEIDLIRYKNGHFNLEELIPQRTTPDTTRNRGKADTKTDTPFEFLLAQARIREGEIRFQDQTLATPFQTRIQNIQLDLRDLDNHSDMPAEIQLDYTTGDGGKLNHINKLYLSPQLRTEGVINIEQFHPAHYAPYYAAALPGGNVQDGQLDGTISYHFTPTTTQSGLEITAEQLSLRNLSVALKKSSKPAIQLPVVTLKNAHIDLDKHSIRIENLALADLAISAVRQKNGELDLLSLTGQGTGSSSSPNWSIGIEQFALTKGDFLLEDRTASKPITLKVHDVNFKAENFSTDKNKATQIDFNSLINQKGDAHAKGNVTLTPLAARLDIQLKSIDLLPLQPYVLAQTKVAISNGNLNAQGELTLKPENDRLNAAFRGQFDIQDFNSIDHLNSTDFVRWRTLSIKGIDFNLAPLALVIDDISLNDFRTRLILSQNGQLNLREIQNTGEEIPTARDTHSDITPSAAINTGPAPAIQENTHTETSRPPVIKINTIRIKGGNIAFTDHFIKPNYDVNLTGMSGQLTGLSSDPITLASLDLKGKIDNAAQATVTGQFNPFRQDRHLDIVFAVKGLELTSLSSYASKYIGYGIEKGKLSAELNYKIEDRKLSATNSIFLDQLTFGSKTDSPDAVNLPVELAVSLLKNRKGEININLPVTGTLDDPQFSVSGIVLDALIRLIGRAITSPFSLLASIGDNTDISYLAFAPGSDALVQTEQDKLASLSQVLLDRPSLRLDIIGRADPAVDITGLKHVQLENQMRAIKLKQLSKQGGTSPSLENITINEEERPLLLKEVYDDGDFKKPRNMIGLAKSLPAEEMEKLILEHTEVATDALHTLAQQRAQTAQQWLLEQGHIPAERIFLLSPKIETPPADTLSQQVQFSLH